jgi:hypothetical protein
MAGAHDVCHRTNACNSGGDEPESISISGGCLFNIIHVIGLGRRPVPRFCLRRRAVRSCGHDSAVAAQQRKMRRGPFNRMPRRPALSPEPCPHIPVQRAGPIRDLASDLRISGVRSFSHGRRQGRERHVERINEAARLVGQLDLALELPAKRFNQARAKTPLGRGLNHRAVLLAPDQM